MARSEIQAGHETGDGALVLASSAHGEAVRRYSDQPMEWRTRLAGMGGTAMTGIIVALGLLITWNIARPMAEPPTLTVVNLRSYQAPPEPVREMSEGPQQVQQEAQKKQEEAKPLEQEQPAPLPDLVVPHLPSLAPAVAPAIEPVSAANAIPETTAPKSLPAPPSHRVSSQSDATWQALLLAHLEKYRRYPARARAARKQGVVHVTFRMNRSGMVLSSAIHRGSGSFDLDQAALATLKRAQPLPAIPADRPDIVELTLPVEFFTR